jgi:hypothetical protein
VREDPRLAAAAARIAELDAAFHAATDLAARTIHALEAANVTITTLETQLSGTKDLQTAVDTMQARVNDLTRDLNATQQKLVSMQPLAIRNAELERMLAPPQGTAVERVTWEGGKVKYAAPDGSKYTLPADAQHRADVIAWMKLGVNESTAEHLLSQKLKAPAP